MMRGQQNIKTRIHFNKLAEPWNSYSYENAETKPYNCYTYSYLLMLK